MIFVSSGRESDCGINIEESRGMRGLSFRRTKNQLRMTLFSWNENYQMHIKSIDIQHHRLIEIVNELHDLYLFNPDDSKAFSAILDSLVKYISTHFQYEETLLRNYEFPDLEKHIAEHRRLSSDFNNYLEKYRNKDEVDVPSLLNFTREWLQNHMLGSDMEYAQFFARQEKKRKPTDE